MPRSNSSRGDCVGGAVVSAAPPAGAVTAQPIGIQGGGVVVTRLPLAGGGRAVARVDAGEEAEQHRHVRAFARHLELDLSGSSVELTDLWVNIMPPTAAHSLHLHPLLFISGTYYVATPRGCSGLKFEDPRLDRFMAAPPRKAGARRENQPHVTYPAQAGNVILFESWLRHEVAANRVEAERISISFNYNWS